MLVAYLSAFACAVCYGVGSILQSIGARRTATTAGALDPRLLVRLAVQVPYLVGMGLDLVGWVLSLVAVRSLPLFAVQAILVASVGVTAVLARIFLRVRLDRAQAAALVVLGLGVVLLAATAAPGKPRPVGSTAAVLIALGILPTALGCFWAGRALSEGRAVLALGGLSGLAFGGTALCARALEADHTLVEVVADPLSWALLIYGVVGMVAFAAALQRGSVTIAMAGQATAETVVPAIIGLTLLGDHARSGSGGIATTGFVLTVLAAAWLAAHSRVEPDAVTTPPPSDAVGSAVQTDPTPDPTPAERC
ncbi:hypothetical protein [Frankia gtarii]|uniref:hypothetical protein n=1 Tax=Frankia gtarii TaxID=2950102 RepID=UPI0021C22E0D|nr:hypothetical protein [Frankia gtarii]